MNLFAVHVVLRSYGTSNYLLLLRQELQLHCLKVLAFSATSFNLTRSGMHFVQLFIFMILRSSDYHQ